MGLQAGAAVEISITENIAIQPELLYFQKGTQTDIDFAGQTTVVEQTLNYIEIPILAKFKFETDQGPILYGTLGPSFGFGIDGKIAVKGVEEEEAIDFQEDMLTRIDVGFSFGVGAQFQIGPGSLFVDARYLLGLTSINEGDSSDIKNIGYGAAVGYLFTLSN